MLSYDLKMIKDKYGEKMMHLCRTLFPSLLEQEGLLFKILSEHFDYNRSLYDDIKEEFAEEEFKDYIYLEPNEEITIDNITIKTIPAYNNLKPFHPRKNNWLGYIITHNNITYYIAGDTDTTKEAENVKCDIALIPIGGLYTMDVKKATELLKTINPKIAIPIHYGSIVGDNKLGKKLHDNL